jgi:hypothetical protein
MKFLRGLFASFLALAAFPIMGLMFLWISTGYEKTKNYIGDTYQTIVRDYGLFDSDPIFIKDEERRNREIQKGIEEYKMVLANSKKANTDSMTHEEAAQISVEDANEAANDEGLKGYPEYEKELQAKMVESAKNPPMSPVQQAMNFLKSSRQTVQDGVNHNELTKADIAAITSVMLSGDMDRLAELDKIYSRKDMVVYDKDGSSQRVIQTNKGLEILKLNKAETIEYEKRMAP